MASVRTEIITMAIDHIELRIESPSPQTIFCSDAIFIEEVVRIGVDGLIIYIAGVGKEYVSFNIPSILLVLEVDSTAPNPLMALVEQERQARIRTGKIGITAQGINI